MRSLLAWSLVLGCGAPRGGPTTVIANAVPAAPDAAPADAEPDAVTEECTSETAATARGDVELTTCHTGDRSSSEQSASQGFMEHDMRAEIVLHASSGKPLSMTLGTWTDGWEWGGGRRLAGVLTSPGGDDVILVVTSSYSAGPGISTAVSLAVYSTAGDAWTEVYGQSAGTLDIAVSADHQVATLSGCVESSGATPAGCGGYSDADPVPVTELRWDGHSIDAQVVTSP